MTPESTVRKFKMADEMHVKGKDLKDLKVIELKKELTERGLSSSGNKNELLARLEDYLLKQGDDLEEIEGVLESDIEKIDNKDLDQEISEDTYDEQDESSEQESKTENSDEKEKIDEQLENIPPPTKKPIKLQFHKLNASTPVGKVVSEITKTASERKEERQKRFGGDLNEKQKKEARAERFGTPVTSITGSQPSNKKGGTDIAKLSKRAERFGAISPLVAKSAQEERIKKRKERFGISVGGLTSDAETRKKMRAERFKNV